jgi:hypothetical protein
LVRTAKQAIEGSRLIVEQSKEMLSRSRKLLINHHDAKPP